LDITGAPLFDAPPYRRATRFAAEPVNRPGAGLQGGGLSFVIDRLHYMPPRQSNQTDRKLSPGISVAHWRKKRAGMMPSLSKEGIDVTPAGLPSAKP
jgi:hypothetical protein